MIQRIQSVWLFMASMLNGALFISKLYATQAPGQTDWTHYGVRDQGNFPLFIMAAVITLLPLVTIFLFKDRKRQKGMGIFSIVAVLGFLTLAVMKTGNISNQAGISLKVQYDFALFLPILSILFIILAIRGIRKDEKLIKSLDRLR